MDEIEKKRQEDLIKNTGTKDPWAFEKTWDKKSFNTPYDDPEYDKKLTEFWNKTKHDIFVKAYDKLDNYWNDVKGHIIKEYKEATQDNVNHPAHYTYGGIELLDFLDALSRSGQFTAFDWGYVMSILQYIVRYPLKNGLQDLKKAQFYLNRLIEMKEHEAQDN